MRRAQSGTRVVHNLALFSLVWCTASLVAPSPFSSFVVVLTRWCTSGCRSYGSSFYTESAMCSTRSPATATTATTATTAPAWARAMVGRATLL